MIIAALGFGAVKVVPNMFVNSMFENKNNPVSQEQIEALSPIDKEGAKRIDATAPVGKDDTWTICVYISGSDLEDAGEDDLSASSAIRSIPQITQCWSSGIMEEVSSATDTIRFPTA